MEKRDRRTDGQQAEACAAQHLVRLGYLIRDRNVHCRYGEIDIVAEKGGMLVFVEVRMRSTRRWGDPSLPVSRTKQRRIILASLEYISRRRLGNRPVRFDVVSIVGRDRSSEIDLIENAFDAGM